MTTFRPGDRVHLKHHARTPATTGTVITETLTAAHVRWDDNHTTTPHHPHHLEPAGEPMTDHFESQTSSTSVTVDRDPSGARVGIMRGGETKHAFTVTPGTAPAFVLAILEAAGVEPLSEHYGDDTLPATSLSRAAHYLSVYANQVNAAAKEAAERDLAAVTVSRDGWKTRAERAESANDRTRGLHAPATVLEAWGSISRSYGNSDACLHCTSEDDSTPTLYPCPTIAALDTHTPETETTP